MKRIEYLLFYVSCLMTMIYNRIFKKDKLELLYSQKLLTSSEVNTYYCQLLTSNKAFMIGRLGATELNAFDHEYSRQIGVRKEITDLTMHGLCNNAGFFPNNKNLVQPFFEMMKEAMNHIDLIGHWQYKEQFYFKKYASQAKRCNLRDIEPILGDKNSWVQHLEGKKVLIVHPFEKTIIAQYKNREKVFPKGFLPNFELKTLKAVQTIAGEKDDRFDTWFEALDYMKNEISQIDFEIAIIGCGAYGFLLADHVKTIGKQAIHMGGATQLLFGIMGQRWEHFDYVQEQVNEYWVRPLLDEKPTSANNVENACYW